MRGLAGPLGIIFGISAAVTWAQRTFLTMAPIMVDQAGGSETVGAVALTAYLVAQMAGTVTGGYLADRVERRILLVALCGLAFPAHLLAVGLAPASAGALTAAAAAGFFGMATLPAIVVMAQEMIPRGAAVGSGIVMGLAWATGSVGVLATGALADVVGPRAASLATMPVLLGGVLLAAQPALRELRTVEG
jgi:MFS family permease